MPYCCSTFLFFWAYARVESYFIQLWSDYFTHVQPREGLNVLNMVGQSWILSGFKYDGRETQKSASEELIYSEGARDSYTLGINEVVFIVWCKNIENASFAYSWAIGARKRDFIRPYRKNQTNKQLRILQSGHQLIFLVIVDEYPEMTCPCDKICVLIDIRDAPSSNWWKRVQIPTATHWAMVWNPGEEDEKGV